MRRTRTIRLTALLGGALTIAAALPAQAHEAAVFHGEDYARTYNWHAYIGACDREGDGHAVRAHWRNSSGDITVGLWDTTATSDCAIQELPTPAVQYRICENDVGCSAWINE